MTMGLFFLNNETALVVAAGKGMRGCGEGEERGDGEMGKMGEIFLNCEGNLMVTVVEIRRAIAQADREYQCLAPLNLYKTSAGEGLVTQVAEGRHLQAIALTEVAVQVRLCEDDYPGWLPLGDLEKLEISPVPYSPVVFSPEVIQARIPQVLQFAQAAMAEPNEYLWGGAIAPNYDCSGLVQAAFAALGIWLPRDSYQQEAFIAAIAPEALQPGDLIFFGTPERTTHVALHIQSGTYIHSSGKDQGRNGIGLDSLVDLSDPISQTYRAQLKGAGRVVQSYISKGIPMGCR
jgi:hypothetical protein